MMTSARIRYAAGAPALVLVAGALSYRLLDSVPATGPQAVFSGSTMGTSYTVKVVAELDGREQVRLQEQLDRLLRSVNAQMSTFMPDSEISRFNASASTEWFDVSKDFAEVAALAKEVSADSAGAFDATVMPLVDAWGFGPKPKATRWLEPREIERMRSTIGMENLTIRLEQPALRKAHPALSLDLSAIAKGFGVDKLAAFLEGAGYARYMVEIGGEIRVSGRNPKGSPWMLGIESPIDKVRAAHRIVALDRGAMATSGDYRNYHEIEGKRASHAIDPRTGYPIKHRLVSVTVIDDTCARADAWATALLVLGPDEGLRLAEQQRLAAYLLVMTDEGVREVYSRRFSRSFLSAEQRDQWPLSLSR